MKIKGLRWIILGLIALVTIINYLDRGTLNYMWMANQKHEVTLADGTVEIQTEKGGIARDLNLIDETLTDEQQQQQGKELLALITMCFMIAYGISQLFSGKMYDKIGTRKGFTVSALLWGAADALASTSCGLKSLTGFRMALGLGEAGPWPGTTKSNAEWFPQKERALAQGIFGAAASMGSILAPIIIPLIFLAFGWRWTFVVVGSLGIIWVIPWLIINKKSPKEHPWITDEERDYILSGQPEAKIVDEQPKTWEQLLSERKNYAVILGRFFLDPIWWMFVTWLPIYLMEAHNLDIKEIAMTAWVPYVGAAIGSVLGGWFSGWLMKLGRTVNYARKAAIVLGALIIIPSMIGAAMTSSAWVAVILMAVVLGGYQFTMTNIQTLASDMQTGKTVGSLAGLGGVAAVLGTIIMMLVVPQITQGGNWLWFFVILASLVPLSVGSIFLFARHIGHDTQDKA
ncbi:MAG: MFS transporter [Paludibacteraceae bacterium]|nr:MFS transporter [Paludibacteraceae bacterium]